MNDQKTTLVTDSIHGSIPLSPIEKKLISTEVYNRLHNVLQNSVVYLTFPANRTSRFIHSLGCLKITGDLFRHGLLNAKKEVAQCFFDDAGKTLQALKESKKFQDDVAARHFMDITPTQLTELNPEVLRCHLYTSVMVPRLSVEHEYLFNILYQSIRLAALLHDAGHPPFSHVTEYAINSTYDWMQSQTDPTPYLKKTTEHLGQFIKNGKAFHETLGFTISIFLLDQVIENYKEAYFKNKTPASGILATSEKKHLYDLIVIKQFTLSILSNSTPFFRSLHDLVDSSMDGDRLDYVIRDQVASGVSREPLRLERLIQAYTLVDTQKTGVKNKKNSSSFSFVPSVRALSTIEDFYIQRFQLYRYVIFHHRVAKFDALLQNCVLTLAKSDLENPQQTKVKNLSNSTLNDLPEKDSTNDDILLNSDISGLWQVLHPSVFTFDGQFVDYYTQWDDSWLLTVLRKHHTVLRKKRGDDPQKQILEVQLEELLSNRKQYYSLYKRGECFLEIDKQFMLSFNKSFNWKRLASQQGGIASKDVEQLKKYIKTVQGTKNKKATSAEITRAIEENGYSLSLIFRLLITLGLCTQDELAFAKNAANELKGEIDDVIFIPKLIKPGIKKDFQLVSSDGQLVDLGKVSRVADELERESLMFPPFFVYLYSTDSNKLNSHNCDKLLKKLGRLLAQNFDNWINKKLNL